ncbi:dTDP-4-amino-4,6-dideoxygalactose transaminase [Rhodoblastus acidophilus]|uniref:dTDP-4-amino-4,6-dideoxygalactose transaminase n=1 Tax=Rhodoblastus acidophilus TaxID=1074 RepID=A0A212QN97_RHOAC|nr:DegT/DnrJ/EryC1/StrS family aminotransferase [Rhodoblastus acidophilus]PPQ38928.1 DegT/DnrJ/EryC1/StrS family aminotransferase [Rhodoblastus acidophilus]RAI17581.1 DegT/DnrJ/EryC1/StrS family aminotransferase [Rhodoblastus acidophilus]SNB60829.1 dTDP-4-amino-4,6-dideoxygalactose transaminase [Rhodoblastus acidophilus]
MIPIALPLLDEAEAEAAHAAVLSGWVSQGPQVEAFEREFAALVGAPHACAVSNCTSALHLALKALDVGPGDEVITVSHSFIATANCIRYCGARPVFVDIGAEGYNIDPERVAAAITPRTRAIVAVHQMGMPCDLAALVEIADRGGLALVEDAACAAGSQINIDGDWEPIGRPRGDIACFSFHPRKVITTGEGGMITTRDPALDRRFRLLRQHGMSAPDTVRHASPTVIFEDYLMVGFNYRMTDIQAAIGRGQLKRLPELVARRRTLAARYGEMLAPLGLGLPGEPAWARSNWQSYCVRLPDEVDQREVMQRMLDRGVATRRGIMCAHREAPFANGAARADLRLSERAQDRCILLPLYAQMSEDDQRHVAAALKAELRLQA